MSLTQQKLIKDFKEEYQKNFVCLLSFVKCSNNCQYHFKSEREFRSKPEAKENAAKLAVMSLGMNTIQDIIVTGLLYVINFMFCVVLVVEDVVCCMPFMFCVVSIL